MELLTPTHPVTQIRTPRRWGPHIKGLSAMIALYRQRRALRKLDAAALHDIGISRSQALSEAKRAPWDMPDNWKA